MSWVHTPKGIYFSELKFFVLHGFLLFKLAGCTPVKAYSLVVIRASHGALKADNNAITIFPKKMGQMSNSSGSWGLKSGEYKESPHIYQFINLIY